jgi:hypothetical protein
MPSILARSKPYSPGRQSGGQARAGQRGQRSPTDATENRRLGANCRFDHKQVPAGHTAQSPGKSHHHRSRYHRLKSKKPQIVEDLGLRSPTWTRTKNLPVNSRLLCQLSYRGLLKQLDYPIRTLNQVLHLTRSCCACELVPTLLGLSDLLIMNEIRRFRGSRCENRIRTSPVQKIESPKRCERGRPHRGDGDLPKLHRWCRAQQQHPRAEQRCGQPIASTRRGRG